MFHRRYTITLNRVYDRITISESGETLELYVDGESGRMVAGLTAAQQKLKEISQEGSTEEQRNEAAMAFAGSIFGTEQAKRLMDFYHGDPACVIGICGKYFNERLAKLIEKAQKKAK